MTNDKFRRLRKQLFPTQKQAAEAIGVTPAAISNYETGKRPVPLWIQRFMRVLEKK